MTFAPGNLVATKATPAELPHVRVRRLVDPQGPKGPIFGPKSAAPQRCLFSFVDGFVSRLKIQVSLAHSQFEDVIKKKASNGLKTVSAVFLVLYLQLRQKNERPGDQLLPFGLWHRHQSPTGPPGLISCTDSCKQKLRS